MSADKVLKFPQINKICSLRCRKKIKMFAFILFMGIFGIFTNYSLQFNICFKTRLKHILNCHDQILKSELLTYGDYWLLKNYIIGRKSSKMGCAESITYTTHGDYRFIEHLPKVVER